MEDRGPAAQEEEGLFVNAAKLPMSLVASIMLNPGQYCALSVPTNLPLGLADQF